MVSKSSIEWTETTWNPVAGCTVVSPGCTNCYAMRMAARLSLMGQEKYIGLTRQTGGRAKWNGRINCDYKTLEYPKNWKIGRTIFVNSMSDLFHENVPVDFIQDVFDVMNDTPQHTYQILTKRAERLEELARKLTWSSNIWMGVSVENQDYYPRINSLRRVPSQVRFLSLEPLLGPLGQINLSGIGWVIVGGESGPNARPLSPDWVRKIRDQCVTQNVAFHFKQWGGPNKKKTGRILDGKTWDELPV